MSIFNAAILLLVFQFSHYAFATTVPITGQRAAMLNKFLTQAGVPEDQQGVRHLTELNCFIELEKLPDRIDEREYCKFDLASKASIEKRYKMGGIVDKIRDVFVDSLDRYEPDAPVSLTQWLNVRCVSARKAGELQCSFDSISKH